MLDRKELTMDLDDFRTIFHLPQVTDNHHDHFIPALTFSKMVPFYINDLDFTPELRLTSNFKTTGLLQPRGGKLAEDDYELRRREKGKHLEEIRNTPSPIIIRSPRIPTNLISLDTEKL
ncbi:hypothetical protein Tco_0370856 [Tanacetum coccineum]